MKATKGALGAVERENTTRFNLCEFIVLKSLFIKKGCKSSRKVRDVADVPALLDAVHTPFSRTFASLAHLQLQLEVHRILKIRKLEPKTTLTLGS